MVVPFEESKLVQIGDPEDVEREKLEPMDVVAGMRGQWRSGVEEVGTVLVMKSTTAMKVLLALSESQGSEPKRVPMSSERSSEARMS